MAKYKKAGLGKANFKEIGVFTGGVLYLLTGPAIRFDEDDPAVKMKFYTRHEKEIMQQWFIDVDRYCKRPEYWWLKYLAPKELEKIKTDGDRLEYLEKNELLNSFEVPKLQESREAIKQAQSEKKKLKF